MAATKQVLVLCLALAAMTRCELNALASTCTPGQLFCADSCRVVQFCGAAGPVVVDTCKAGAVCSYVTGSCVDGDVCVTPPNEEFPCHAVGAFPDPYDCTRYYQCINSASMGTGKDCITGKAFDSLSGRCSLPLDSRPCREGPVPPCTSVGQVGPQPENPNIFYVCVRNSFNGVLSPWLYKCESTEAFVGDKCVEDVLPTSTTSTTPTTASTTPTTASTTPTTASTTPTTASTTPTTASTTPTTASTTPTTGTTSSVTTATSATTSTPFTCPSKGQFADPMDCRKYFLCNSDLQPNSFTCQDGYHFDAAKGCVAGTC